MPGRRRHLPPRRASVGRMNRSLVDSGVDPLAASSSALGRPVSKSRVGVSTLARSVAKLRSLISVTGTSPTTVASAVPAWYVESEEHEIGDGVVRSRRPDCERVVLAHPTQQAHVRRPVGHPQQRGGHVGSVGFTMSGRGRRPARANRRSGRARASSCDARGVELARDPDLDRWAGRRPGRCALGEPRSRRGLPSREIALGLQPRGGHPAGAGEVVVRRELETGIALGDRRRLARSGCRGPAASTGSSPTDRRGRRSSPG